MLDLDDTSRCPVGPECETCGRLDELAVSTAETPEGMLCTTLCDVCEGHRGAPDLRAGVAERPGGGARRPGPTPDLEPEPEPEIPVALPERVAVTLPKDRGADEAPVIYLARLDHDHDEIRRLRGEGLSRAELKTRFKLPEQVLRAAAGDVDPHQAEKARAAAKPPAPKMRADGKPRRWAATRERT